MIARMMLMSALAACAGCSNMSQVVDTGTQLSQAAGYNPAQLSEAVKEALALSVTRASDDLSQKGGYSSGVYRLHLPEEVEQITSVMKQFGLGDEVEKVENLMNQGAEIAAAEAKATFLQAVSQMSVDDAIGIVRGGDTSATDFFRAQTEGSLQQRYQSIMQGQLKKLGFYSEYQQLLGAYKLLPIANKPNLDLEQAAVSQGIEGLFAQIGEEEKNIRQNPMETGNLLISSIFGKK